MKQFILFVVLSIAFAIPRSLSEIVRSYPNEGFELFEPAEVKQEVMGPAFDIGLEEPSFDNLPPVDEIYPDNEGPAVNVPSSELYPVEETQVDEIIPEIEIPVLEYVPEEEPVDPSINDDDFVYIKYPQFPSFSHPMFHPRPFFRTHPTFGWADTDVKEEPLFIRRPSRRPSILDILFPRYNQFPSMFNSENDRMPTEHHPRHEFHSVYNNFFNHPRRPFEPTFKFDTAVYPDNYKNSTHKIHDVNGTKFSVNETINKQSGDNFHTFFHVRVIKHLPEIPATEEEATSSVGDLPVLTTTGEDGTTSTDAVPETPVVEEESIPTRGDTAEIIRDIEVTLPVQKANGGPKIPESFNEADNEIMFNREASSTI